MGPEGAGVTAPRVTAHAVVRWLQRVHGFTQREFEEEILGDLRHNKHFKKFSGTVRLRKCRLVVKRGVVVTVLPKKRGRRKR